MKDNSEKYIKEILKGLEKDLPSASFTENVMNQIMSEEIVIKNETSFFENYKFILVISLTFFSISLMVFLFPDYNHISLFNRINFNFSPISLLEKTHNYLNVDFNFSSIYLVIIASVFTLFSLDTILQRIRINKL